MDGFWTFLERIARPLPSLLVILGVAVFVIGLADGVAHDNWLVIKGPAKTFTALGGVVIFALGVFFSRRDGISNAIPKAKTLKLQIQHPQSGDTVDQKEDVRGTHAAKSLPAGYVLRILRGYPEQGGFIPFGTTTIDFDNGTWQALRFEVGGNPGDRRSIEVWLVGPDGQALLNCWSDCHAIHRKAQNALMAATDKYAEWLPPIKTATRDMVLCQRVSITRKVIK